MPGWILVANRFLILPFTRDNGRLFGAIASLICLAVLSGCSNIRQQALDLPLPVLPSEAATALQTTSDQSQSIADSGGQKTGSALDQTAFENDFTASDFDQPPSVQSYLLPENDVQPQEPHARFVGVLDKAEMTEIKLSAITEKAAPAPAITQASQDAPATCEAPETCGVAQCECHKKIEVPKLVAIEPLDPEELPDLFGPNRIAAQDTPVAPLQPTLRPLQATDDVQTPIRLRAMPSLETVKLQQPVILTEPKQAKNKAQQLIPSAPSTLQASQSNPTVTQPIQTIKVTPVMDLGLAVIEKSPAVQDSKVATDVLLEAPDSTATVHANQSKFIPVSSSGIQVSAIPFQALRTRPPKPVPAPAAPVVALIATPKPKVQPIEIAKPKPKFQPIEIPKAIEVSPVVQAPNFTESPDVFVVHPLRTNNDFPPLRPNVVKPIEVIDRASDEFVVATPATAISPVAAIDPLIDLNSLPDMSQIEKELAELEKSNTFDPSTVIKADTIDPTRLLAKLDGPKAIPVPVAKVAKPDPDKDLITQQLAAQSSALLELQDAISELKPKPVPVIPKAPELTLSNAAFCTKISGFGQFKPFATNTFSGSQKTLLYCEVENQTSKQFTNSDGSNQFETVLHGSIVIYDANDQVVQAAKFPAIKDVARQRRRDFYVYFPVQFNDLVPGDYRLELSVEDVAQNDTAVLRPFMRFSVR